MELLGRYSKLPDPWQKLADLRVRLTQTSSEPTPVVGVPSATRRWRLDHRLTDETVAKLVCDYVAGASSYALADTYGISKWAVLHLLKHAGVGLRRQGLSDQQLAEAVARYEEGQSLAQVAAAVGASKTTVANTLRRAGVQLRTAQRREPPPSLG